MFIIVVSFGIHPHSPIYA